MHGKYQNVLFAWRFLSNFFRPVYFPIYFLAHLNRYPQYKELEYAIAAQERGNGYAVEAVEAMLRYAFLQRDISVVAAWVRAFNQPSVRVLQRCRFTYEGTLRRHARDKGDTLCYSILKEEWMESQKENLK